MKNKLIKQNNIMPDEYIILNKTAIQKRIDKLKESLKISEVNDDSIRAGIESFEIKQLEWCLSQSTPLIPEIEMAINKGYLFAKKSLYNSDGTLDPKIKEYISSLKPDMGKQLMHETEDKGYECPDSPSGYCEYNWEESNEFCIYCGEPEERK